jgi:LuxR family transcriptional regulator of csgAB operon
MEQRQTPRPAPTASPEKSCLLLGANNLQTTLFADFISNTLNCDFAIQSQFAALEASKHDLILIDNDCYACMQVEEFLDQLHTSGIRATVGIINVGIDCRDFSRLLEWPSLKGIFYSRINKTKLIEGIQHLLNEEYWLPRNLTHILLNKHRQSVSHQANDIPLTKREREILIQLSMAKSNARIADTLCISEHTIKSHLYKIFKKLGIGNRLEAATWAKENLALEIRQSD